MLLLHRDSRLFKLACLLPKRWVAIERARVGTDCVHYYHVWLERRRT